MKNFLRKLKLSRVDLVPAGANPGAHIALYKAQTKTEDGKAFPASDYAYVPDPENPSKWKLRLTAEPYGEPDPRIIGAAVAAFGKEFRGQEVQIPQSDLSEVKRKVLQAWLKTHPDLDSADAPEILKEKIMPENQNMDEQSTKEPGIEELKAEIERLKAENEKLKAELSSKSDDEVEKSETEIVEDSDVRKELDATKAQLAEMQKAQEFAECVAKAKDYEELGQPKEVAKLLMASDKHFSDDEKALFSQLLKSAKEQVQKGALFSRLSKDVAEPAGWEDRLAEAARDRVAKGDAKTVEQAKVAIMSENNELRKEFTESLRS